MTELLVRRPLDETFAFFADAGNLQRLTPPWLSFRIVTPLPIEMREGALIDYRISLHGIPIPWRTKITAWEPPYKFVDEQLWGPYLLWRHTHTFEGTADGTWCRDTVDYRVPGGSIVDRLIVRRDLERIFTFRQHATLDVFKVKAAHAITVHFASAVSGAASNAPPVRA